MRHGGSPMRAVARHANQQIQVHPSVAAGAAMNLPAATSRNRAVDRPAVRTVPARPMDIHNLGRIGWYSGCALASAPLAVRLRPLADRTFVRYRSGRFC